MGSNDYKYFSQTAFNGGIETRQENIKANQLLDARNYWQPLGPTEQRPGSRGSIYTLWQGAIGATSAVTPVIWTNTATGVNTTLTPFPIVLTPINYGDVITFRIPSIASVNPCVALAFAVTGLNAVAKTRLVFEVWTSSGWEGIQYDSLSGIYPSSAAPSPFSVAQWGVNAAFPANFASTTLTFTGLGSFTGFFIRAWVRSATDLTGVPFTAATTISVVAPVFISNKLTNQLNSNSAVYSAGAYLLKYASGNRVVTIGQLPQTTGGLFSNLPAIQLNVQNSLALTSGISTGLKYSPDYGRVRCPPTVAVIPEFNTAFIAFANTVFEVPYAGPYTQTDTYVTPSAGTATGPLVAQVNSDPLVVGPISISNPFVPYSVDITPQLTSFPAANLIVYFKDQLWAAGILGDPTTIRWSGGAADNGYNVWPEQNQVPLSTARDNSEITAISPLGDNLVVFKKNSIWQMVDNGISDTGPQLPLYEPKLVVAGVGCVAQASVQAVMGGLIFLGEDGFYFYDGTPNIKRISDPVMQYLEKLNPARMPFAVSTLWRTKQVYICATSSETESQQNDMIFVYDFNDNAWWIWDGYDVQCWYQQDGVGLQEELYSLDSFRRAFQFDSWNQTDNGAYIDSWALTGRMGFADAVTKTSRELRVRGIANNPVVSFEVIGDDIEVTVPNVNAPLKDVIFMPRANEAQYDSIPAPLYGVANYVPSRRRERKEPGRRVSASWFQIKIYKMLKLLGLDIGYEQEGRR